MNFDILKRNNVGFNYNTLNSNKNKNINNVTKRRIHLERITPKIYRKYNVNGKLKRKKLHKKRTLKLKQKLPAVVFGHVYSDQCGYCRNMQNDWDNLRAKTKVPLYDIGDDYENKIKSFNTKYNTDLKYSGFPTIFRLKKHHDTVEYYNGNRTTNSMLQWLHSR